jgi:acyl carrier protein
VTSEDLAATVRRALADIAPDVDADTMDPAADLRDEAGLDSMDILNFAVALHELTGIDIPERDYPAIATLGGCVAYLEARGARSLS